MQIRSENAVNNIMYGHPLLCGVDVYDVGVFKNIKNVIYYVI